MMIYLFSGRYYEFYEESVSKAMDALELDIEKLQDEQALLFESPLNMAILAKSILVCRGKYAILFSELSNFTRLRSETNSVLKVDVEPYYRCPSSVAMPSSSSSSSSQNNTCDVDVRLNHPIGTAKNHNPHHQEVGVDVGHDDGANDSAQEGDSADDESDTNNEQ
jgi:hypothetical protein